MKLKVKDPVIKKVLKKFNKRSKVGFSKYGTTLRDDPGDMLYWLNHLQEELMDAVNYVERLKEQVEKDYYPDPQPIEHVPYSWYSTNSCSCTLGQNGRCCKDGLEK